jgi:hypothetical protein
MMPKWLTCLFRGHDWIERDHDQGWSLFHIVKRECLRCGFREQFAERWEDGTTPGCDGSLEP